MKSSMLAVVVLGAFSTGASAQSSINLYGIIDLGYVYESGGAAGSVSKLTSGIASGSRLGFKGTEDLGGGRSALFVLESGFQADTGTLGQGGLLFGRQAYVGLSSTRAGTLTVGRQYTPQFLALDWVDPFDTGLAGASSNIFHEAGDQFARMNNSIKYTSPKFNGFDGELVYGLGEVAGSNGSGRQFGFALGYAEGPLLVRLSYHNLNNNDPNATPPVTGTENAKNTLLGATYDFGVAKAHFAYSWNKGLNSATLNNNDNPYGLNPATRAVASKNSQDLLLGVSVPYGPHKFLASYIHRDDKEAAHNNADQFGIGYLFAMSTRTDLYTAYAKIWNKNNASYTVGSAIEAGSGDSAFNLGFRHRF
jgi:predicted porin